MSEVVFIPIEKLKIADYNPREARSPEIIQGIIETAKKDGIIKPLLVRKYDDGYEVFEGGTRLIALQKLGAREAPCRVFNISKNEAIKLATKVHFLREDLTVIERGKHIAKCLKMGVWKSVEEVSEDLGIPSSTIYRWLREAGAETVKLSVEIPKHVNKEVQKILTDIPKDVRQKIVNEIENMDKSVLEAVKEDLPKILREIKKEDEPQEAVKKFKAEISRKVEKKEKVKEFRGPSGYKWHIFLHDNNVAIFKLERDTLVQQIEVPHSDIKMLCEVLKKFM